MQGIANDLADHSLGSGCKTTRRNRRYLSPCCCFERQLLTQVITPEINRNPQPQMAEILVLAFLLPTPTTHKMSSSSSERSSTIPWSIMKKSVSQPSHPHGAVGSSSALGTGAGWMHHCPQNPVNSWVVAKAKENVLY
jgi:hypothetical protein